MKMIRQIGEHNANVSMVNKFTNAALIRALLRSALTQVVVASSVGISFLATIPTAIAQDGGHWLYQWSKSGKSQAQGVLNYYSNFPQVASRTFPSYNNPWNVYDGIENPLGQGDSIGHDAGMATDESLTVATSGSLGFVLVWVPGPNNEPPPRKLFMFEQLTASAELNSYILPNQQNTIHDYKSVVKTNFPEMNEPNIVTSSVTSVTDDSYLNFDLEYKRRTSNTTRLTIINNSQSKSRIALGTANGSAHISGSVIPGETQGGAGHLSIVRFLCPMNINLGLRRHGSGEAFSSLATVAVGHKTSDEHLVDVQVTLQPAMQGRQVPAGLKVPFKVVLPRDWEVSNGAKFIPAENPVTDSQGKAIIGVIKSSDKLTSHTEQPLRDKRILVKLNLGLGENDPKAYINQTWATFDWKMGENGEKEWNSYFFAGDDDYEEWVWAKAIFGHTTPPAPQTPVEIPLTQHTMKFVVNRLYVREKNEEDEWVNRLYTTHPQDSQEDYPDVQELIYSPNFDTIADKYVQFAPATAVTDNNGQVKTKMTIIKDPQRTVTNFEPGLEDQGVYHP